MLLLPPRQLAHPEYLCRWDFDEHRRACGMSTTLRADTNQTSRCISQIPPDGRRGFRSLHSRRLRRDLRSLRPGSPNMDRRVRQLHLGEPHAPQPPRNNPQPTARPRPRPLHPSVPQHSPLVRGPLTVLDAPQHRSVPPHCIPLQPFTRADNRPSVDLPGDSQRSEVRINEGSTVPRAERHPDRRDP